MRFNLFFDLFLGRSEPSQLIVMRGERMVGEISRRHRSDREKINAFIAHIRANCSYRLAPYLIPPGEDATEHFLLREKQGWCVHFASALAVMCRLADIPAARYFT